ncbi:Peptide hydrolase [Tolypocladium paradoxum]|uniref:Peptide hydrolase n=1 Tax=Tolypocladium paradoxum TaxID=94208 RepID=A0A2S4L500_9HYPO|nr:Peptide hydrolase [Tolypocladium paradoxum]
MKLLSSVFCAGILATGVAGNLPLLTPWLVEHDMEWKELNNWVFKFHGIAQQGGWNRAFGTSGDNRTRELLISRTQNFLRKHLDTTIQKFTHMYEHTSNITLTGPGGENVPVMTLEYNHATPLPGGISAPLVETPVDDEHGTACFEGQWQGVDAAGKIALIKRGKCAISDKVRLAREHGALAVVLYNQVPGNTTGPMPKTTAGARIGLASGNVSSATLGVDNVGKLVPVGLVGLHDGLAWSKRLAAGETFNVRLVVDAIAEEREGWNVIADSKSGSNESYIMIGAHYDSGPNSPGINDNASGVIVMLEIMRSIKKYTGNMSKVRYAFWGAGKKGQIGSLHYASQLTEQEADKVKFYINLDMIASPKPIYAIYADDEADKVGAEILFQHLTTKQKQPFFYPKKPSYPAFYAKHGNTSDYVAFRSIGIPTTGVFTGGARENDECHGMRCDDKYNIGDKYPSLYSFEDVARAVGYTVASLAINPSRVPPRKKTCGNPASKNGVLRTSEEWEDTRRMMEKERPCCGGSNVV